MSKSPLYAVIDLGSNSFHMLITRLVADSVQVVDRVRRKVRLASGLNHKNLLDDTAMARGFECLSFFAERLQDIPPQNIRVVATATLRIATNRDFFLSKAKSILGRDIDLLTGEQEAQHIYLGVAHTSCCLDKRLVFDIGGASTEIIIGHGFSSLKVSSLDIGCVTFMQQYFSDGQLSTENFDSAVNGAKKIIAPLVNDYLGIGWQSALSGSGTMQALAEILMHRHQPAVIFIDFLLAIKQELLLCKTITDINIPGLEQDRTPVIASGISILIALFESFSIDKLQLSSGALREGLLYEMLPDMRKISIRQRTINSIAEKFHIDKQHAYQISKQAETLFDHVCSDWQLVKDNSYKLLLASCSLHEVGLLLEYKHHPQHGAYIIQHADMPGFDQADKQLLATLVQLQKADINLEPLKNQSATRFETARYLLVLLRLAIILCRRRKDDVLPDYQAKATTHGIHLFLPTPWLTLHPLIADELCQENLNLQTFGLTLTIHKTD